MCGGAAGSSGLVAASTEREINFNCSKEKAMPTIGDTSIQRFKYEGITLDQWKALKAQLARDFKFAIKEDIGKHEYGSSVYEWQQGVFEWEFRVDHNKKPELGVLEFGIRRRPFDPPQTNLEIVIAEFFKG